MEEVTVAESACKICTSCNSKQLVPSTVRSNNDDPIDKCKNWLDNCALEDSSSLCSSDCGESLFSQSTDNSAMDSGYVFQNNGIILANTVQCNDENRIVNKIFTNKSNKYENVRVYKSKKVHIGDVTYIEGPIIVNQLPSRHQIDSEKSNLFMNKKKDFTGIIVRRNWLAQPPLGEKDYLPEPAKFVIICHSATEEGLTQAENTLLVRLIQTFHIESRKWNDIAYNFLIGSDGTVFEGRGWGVRGAHAHKYNAVSVGICFIGCFLNHLPPTVAIRKAKDLIEHGVKVGALDKNYSVIAHCQCTSSESPGKRLFEEIQTWDRWNASVSVMAPSPLIL